MKLNARQTQILYLDDSKDIRIEGKAGSGKSLIALYRAVYLAFKYPDKKILLTCHNNALQKEISKQKEILKQRDNLVFDSADHGNLNNLEIETIYKSAQNFLKKAGNVLKENLNYEFFLDKTGEVLPALEIKYKKSIIEKIYIQKLEKVDEKNAVKTEVSNIIDEINWIQDMAIDNWETYYNVERVGRSNFRLPREKRKFIFDIFMRYLEERESGEHTYKSNQPIFRYYDFHDIGQLGKRVVNKLKTAQINYSEECYDIIIVDEYQDLSTDMFFTIQNLLKNRGHLELIGDPDQSIFGNRISWKSIGVDAVNMKKYDLKTNHRNTKQIYKVAKVFAEDKKDYAYTPKEGEKPIVGKVKTFESEIQLIIRRASRYDEEKIKYAIIYEDRDYKLALKDYIDTDNLWSVHKVKGLEFDAVIVPNFSDKKLTEAKENPDSFSAFKKRAYVALTRACDELFLTTYGELNSMINKEDVIIYEI